MILAISGRIFQALGKLRDAQNAFTGHLVKVLYFAVICNMARFDFSIGV